MKGTRLWNETGSPLIHGASRSRGPLVIECLKGAAVSIVAVLVILAYSVMMATPTAVQWTPVATLGATLRVLPAAATSLVFAFAGAWFARRMGWRREWAAGAALGILLGLAVHAAFFTFVVQTAGK